jgi:putative molybdopterin biosynthesis protein
MTDGPGTAGTAGAGLRLARQARGFSQQQLAGMAGVSRQAVSAVESGHSDPSLRVALALAQSLGMSVEELFGPGEPAALVTATSLAAMAGHRARAGGERVMLAPVGDRLVALPLRGDTGSGLGFLPAGGLAVAEASADPDSNTKTKADSNAKANAKANADPNATTRADPEADPDAAPELIAVRPIGPPRPTLLVAGCDPAFPLLATPLSLLDPPVAFAWWPCGSGEALRLARAGLVHAAGVHAQAGTGDHTGDHTVADGPAIPDEAQVVGFTAWREGLVVSARLRATVTGLDAIAKHRLRLVNREPGAEARRLLDRERVRLNLEPSDLIGYDTQAAGHLQVASAVAAGLADAGVASEPAARAYGLEFVPLARERFDLVIPAEHAASREVQALLKVLTSPWLLAQLAGIPGYDAATCGERFS